MSGWVLDLGNRRPRTEPLDNPGADVGERLRTVQVTVTLDFHLPNPKWRMRRDRSYPREDIAVHRMVRFSVNHQALDEPDGDLRLATAIGRQVLRQLRYEGWPVKFRSSEGDTRPGA